MMLDVYLKIHAPTSLKKNLYPKFETVITHPFKDNKTNLVCVCVPNAYSCVICINKIHEVLLISVIY